MSNPRSDEVISDTKVWYGILEFNVPLNTV